MYENWSLNFYFMVLWLSEFWFFEKEINKQIAFRKYGGPKIVYIHLGKFVTTSVTLNGGLGSGIPPKIPLIQV